jgi:hypothetical protein
MTKQGSLSSSRNLTISNLKLLRILDETYFRGYRQKMAEEEPGTAAEMSSPMCETAGPGNSLLLWMRIRNLLARVGSGKIIPGPRLIRPI